MTAPTTIFGSAAFARVLAERSLVALDIGARRGFVADLLPIAAAVDAIGFEPDAGECERLNREARSTKGPWRSLRFIATALAGETGRHDLHLTRRGGTSSMLAAFPGVGARYMRDDYFAVERRVTVDTLTLDDALARFEIGAPAYLKVDVEGMEKAIFEGGSRTLDHVLAVRTEVAFMPTRHGQPLHHEIDALLQAMACCLSATWSFTSGDGPPGASTLWLESARSPSPAAGSCTATRSIFAMSRPWTRQERRPSILWCNWPPWRFVTTSSTKRRPSCGAARSWRH